MERQIIDFQPRTWKDDPEGGTPLDAANLNRMEAGIADAVRAVNGASATAPSCYVVERDGMTAHADEKGVPISAPCYVYDRAAKAMYFDSGSGSRFPAYATEDFVGDSIADVVKRQGGGVRTGVTDLNAVNASCIFTTIVGCANKPPYVSTSPVGGIEVRFDASSAFQIACSADRADNVCVRKQRGGSWSLWQTV